MSTNTAFALAIRTKTAIREILRSDDPDMLTACGTAIAPTTEHGSELVLMGKRGRAIAEYDIWTSQWNAAA